jgi:ADP-heptose:LPS heptosyltransferase
MSPGRHQRDGRPRLRPAPGPDSTRLRSAPERILLVRLSHLGDVVHALGIFHALRAAHPGAEIAWAVQDEFAELVASLPGLTRVIGFDRRGGLGAWFRFRRELRDFRAEWSVDAQGNSKSAAAAWLSGAPRRTASARADWQEPWAAWTTTEHAPGLVPPARHAMERMAELARFVAPTVALPLRTDAALSAAEIDAGRRALAERVPRTGRRLFLVHLSTPGDIRGWPLEHWAGLVEALCASERGVLVLSGPAEAGAGAELARRVPAHPGVAHWIGQRGLRLLAAVFRAAAERGAALIACDSGPMHLAAAHGLRVLLLEGPQDAARTGPWPVAGTGTVVGEAPHRAVRASIRPPCAPCLARRCRHPDGPVCLLDLRPPDVLAAVRAGE